MKKTHIGVKNGKIYISKQVLTFGAVLISVLLGFLLFINRNENNTVYNSRPLGVAPSGAQDVPKDPEAAANFMAQKIQEENLNKLVIIFYYDGYGNQDTAVNHAKTLADVLTTKSPYKDLKDIITYKIITSGRICQVEREELICELRYIEALQKLGIEHIKIVILHPEEFIPAVNLGLGADSVIAVSTKKKADESDAAFKNRLQTVFGEYLSKSLSPSVENVETNEYLSAAISCFYGNKESYRLGLVYKSCKDFKAKYPKFWEYDVK